jgi:hypothetical protein
VPKPFKAVRDLKVAGKPKALDFTNDGSLLAIGLYPKSPDGPRVQVIRTQDEKVVAEFGVGAHSCVVVAFADEGRRLCFLLQLNEGGVELWSSAIGKKPERHVPLTTAAARGLVRDGSGRLLAITGVGVTIWDSSMNAVVTAVLGDAEQAKLPMVAAFGPKEASLFIYGRVSGKIVLDDLKTATETGRWDDSSGRHVAFTPSEKWLITFAGDARAFRLSDEELTTAPKLPGRRTWAAAQAYDAPLVAYGIDDDRLAMLHMDE